jgi:hypothetical protein
MRVNWPDKVPSDFPDAREHALVILEALDGNWQTAIDNMPVYIEQYGLDYALRLEACFRPKGEA